MNRLGLLIAGAAFAIGAGAGQAATLTVSQQNTNALYGTNGFLSGKLELERSGPDFEVTANIGGFALKSGVTNFVAWCLDIGTDLTLPSTYSTTTTPFSGTTGTISASRVGNIQKLFNTAYGTLNLTSAIQSAGFQIALWEILFETDSRLDSEKGAFEVSGTAANRDGATTFANTLLKNLTNAASTVYALTFLESAKDSRGNPISQNLVSVMPSVVPLPAAALLVVTAMAGFVGLGRIKRRKA